MDLYHVVLFAHILGAIVLVGMGFVMPVFMGGMRRAQTVSSFRDWATAAQKVSKAGSPAAVIVLLSGLYMGWAKFSFADGWLAVSLVLFVVAGAIAGGVLDPSIGKVVDAAAKAPDGPVPDELKTLPAVSKLHTFEALLFGVDLSIVFLMTNKPGLAMSLVIAATGLAIGAARLAVSARRHAHPAVTA